MASNEDRLKIALEVLKRIPQEFISEEKRGEFARAMQMMKATTEQADELQLILLNWKDSMVNEVS